jgi:hypothetical protein
MSKVEIKLTKDEALVLFDFVSRFSNDDKLIIQDQAEERALLNLTCVLEKQLAEPFSPDWKKIIEAAKNRLRNDI